MTSAAMIRVEEDLAVLRNAENSELRGLRLNDPAHLRGVATSLLTLGNNSRDQNLALAARLIRAVEIEDEQQLGDANA